MSTRTPTNAPHAALARLVFDRSRPLQRQITQGVRELILAGQLPEGLKVPSVQELAKLWITTIFTVNRGLQPLMKEGLLERRRKIGTTVRRRRESKMIGIYLADKYLFTTASRFYAALYLRLQEAILQSGYSCRLWVDTRPREEHSSPPEDLSTAIERREIIGLISPNTRLTEVPWLRKLTVPVTSIANIDRFPVQMVDNDYGQMFEMFASTLQRKACKSVGVILPFSQTQEEGTPSAEHVFEKMHSVLKAHRIELRPEWLLAKKAIGDHATFGFQQFMNLWGGKRRPQGLIVYPDTVVEGVLLAIWRSGVRIPEELQLCLHCNEDLPIHCPFEATWAETSTSSFAHVLFDSLRARIEGRMAPAQMTLPLRLVEGANFPR